MSGDEAWQVRKRVRADLQQFDRGCVVIVACSGGADSLALAAAMHHEAAGAGVSVGVITIDHRLQAGSDVRAKELVERLQDDFVFAEAIAVDVGSTGGPEAAARTARYAALDAAADRYGAEAIYLGHTAGDQAETVLMGLGRGSGTRSLSGMAASIGRYRRPMLDLPREVVRTAGRANPWGITPWEDPHNSDPRFLRPRVRDRVLPILESELGPGIEAALLRTARLLREDADALDAIAAGLLEIESSGALVLGELVQAPRAIRARVLMQWLRNASVPSITAEHVERLDALVADWRGQGAVALPGGWSVSREQGRLSLRRE